MSTTTVDGNKVTLTEVIKDAGDRAKTETPPFFERIRGWAKVAAWICGGVATVGMGVITTFASAGITLPLYVTITVGVLSGIGGLGTTASIAAVKIAGMTTSNREILNRPSNEVVRK